MPGLTPSHQVAEAAAHLARRQQVHRVVADLREEGLAVGVDSHRLAHDVRPPREAAQVAAPVRRAFVPAAVVVAPDGIDVEKDVRREPHPVLGPFDLAEKGDADLAQEVPGPIGVARVGLPQVPGAQVAVHLVAANLHHLAADVPLLLAKQVVDEGIGPREIVVVRHARLIVVAVAGAALRVPFGAVEQDSPGLLPVLVLPAEQPGEGERRSAIQCSDGVGAVPPPHLAPVLALAFHVGRIFRRLFRGRRTRKNPLALFHQSLVLTLHLAACQLAQAVQILRPQEEARVRLGDSGHQFAARRQRHRHGVTGNRKSPRLAPGGLLTSLVLAPIPPRVAACPECPGRAMHVEFDAGGPINHVFEVCIAGTFDFPRQTLLRPPTEARRVRL